MDYKSLWIFLNYYLILITHMILIIRIARMWLNRIKKNILFIIISFLCLTDISSSTFWFSSLHQNWWWFIETNNFMTENTEHHQNQTQTKAIKTNTYTNQYTTYNTISFSIKSHKGKYLFSSHDSFSINNYSSLVGIIKLTI